MYQNNKHINQGSTLRWNKTSTQKQDQHWNAGTTEVQHLNPCEPDQKTNLTERFQAEAIITPEARPADVQLTVGNQDWVNYQARCLSHNIHVVSVLLQRMISFLNWPEKHSDQQFFSVTFRFRQALCKKSFETHI